MKLIRKIVFWTHLIAGVVAGVIILKMAVTGALIAFEPQILSYAESHLRKVTPPAAEAKRLSAQELLKRASAYRQNAKPTGLTMEADASSAAIVNLGRDGVLFINPYTGDILGEGSGARAFFHGVTEFHRWFSAQGDNREIGKAITGAANAIFLFLIITGIVIWWPKSFSKQHLTAVTVYNFRLKGRARDFNWHNVTGIWLALLLLITTATGLIMSYQWANNLLFTLTGSTPPVANRSAKPGEKKEAIKNIDLIWASAEKQSPQWQSMTMRLPSGGDAAVSFFINDSANQYARSQLVINGATGEIIKWEPSANFNTGRRLRSWVKPIHTGEAGGLLGQIVAFNVCLGTIMLVVTGLLMALRRLRK